MNRILLFPLLLVLICTACHKKSEYSANRATINPEEAMVRVNKYLVKQDADKIKGFISRHGWKMEETKSGLWVEILEKGKGKPAKTGQRITLTYKEWLLDGTLCYTSDKDGEKTFTIGSGGVEPGLELGVLMLHEGDKARFIMPPHLGYGLIGDENKIPARAILVYELQVIKITD